MNGGIPAGAYPRGSGVGRRALQVVLELVEDVRVELAGRLAQLGERGVRRQPVPVGPVASQGGVGVDHRDDARGERDARRGETVRIAAAVEPLVVEGDERGDRLETR